MKKNVIKYALSFICLSLCFSNQKADFSYKNNAANYIEEYVFTDSDFYSSDWTASTAHATGAKQGVEEVDGNRYYYLLANSEDANEYVYSNDIAVEPDTIYEVNYTGSFIANTLSQALCYVEFDRSSYFFPEGAFYLVGSSLPRNVSFSFKTLKNTCKIRIFFSSKGVNAKFCFDDLKLSKVNKLSDSDSVDNITKLSNLDFEYKNQDLNKPLNWSMSTCGSYSSFLEVDETYYHHGSQSAHIKKDGISEKVVFSSDERIRLHDNKANTKYEFSAWVKSRYCDPTTKLTMNLIFFDEDGEQIPVNNFNTIYQGVGTVLNAGVNVNEWKEIKFHTSVNYYCEKACYFSYYFTIGAGRAELWIDDVSCRIFEIGNGTFDEDGNEKVDSFIFSKNFHGYDENGKSDWTITKDNAAAATLNIDQNEGILHVAGGSAFATTKVNVFQTGYTYKISGDYETVSDSAVLAVNYFNTKKEKTSDVKFSLPRTDNKFELTITTEACTFATIDIGFFDVDEADITIKNLIISLVSTAKSSSTKWNGDWIWYDEEASTTCLNDQRFFRYDFEIPVGHKVTYAPLQISVDDIYDLYINNINVVEVYEKHFNKKYTINHYNVVNSFDISPFIHEGKNVMAIRGENGSSVAGVLFDCRMMVSDGNNEYEKIIASKSFETIAAKLPSNSPLLNKKELSFAGNIYGFDFDLTQQIPEWVDPNLEIDSSLWKKCRKLGTPPDSPWGAVFYDTSLYVSNKIYIVKTETPTGIKAGETIEFKISLINELPIVENFDLNVNVFLRNSNSSISSGILNLVDNTDMTKWPVNQEFTITVSFKVPKFLETGDYSLQLIDDFVTITNTDIYDALFVTLTVKGLDEKVEDLTAKIENYNNAPTLMINDKPYSPMIYLRPEADRYLPGCEGIINDSNLPLYSCNPLHIRDIWNQDGSINFTLLDQNIYSLMSVNSDVFLMVYINMWAPDWWKDENPEEIVKISTNKGEIGDGFSDQVSLASSKYKQESGEILRRIIAHMKTQNYYNKVFAIKISDGVTHEWMYYDCAINYYPDYSNCAIEGFKDYLQTIYSSVDELREAWNDPYLTFDNVVPPTHDERFRIGNGSIVMDPSVDRPIIDFNMFLNYTSADTFIYYSKIAKEETNYKKIVGGYFGYIWNQNGYDGIGQIHSYVENVLNSPYIDFIASPISYSERFPGHSIAYMPAIDSVLSHGKLYILEMDNRTSVGRNYSDNQFFASMEEEAVGLTYTLEDTILQERMNIVQNFTSGIGMWFFDMFGSWLNDPQIMELYATYLEEYNFSLNFENRSNKSEVAVIVDEEEYANVKFDPTYNATYFLLNFNYRDERINLSRLGTSYDIYTMNDVVEGKVKDYKMYIMLTPLEVDQEERDSIKKYLKTPGSTIVWQYLSGYSNGREISSENISSLVDMNIKVENQNAAIQVKLSDDKDSYLDNINGMIYGNWSIAGSAGSYVGDYSYIDDDNATVIGKTMHGNDDGLAYKDVPCEGGTYRTIYSASMDMPADLLRNIAKECGIHIYNDDSSNITYVNNNYVAIYSGIEGNKTINLGNNYAVFDVLNKEYISMCTDTIELYLEECDTALYRLTPVNTYAVDVTINGHGNIDTSLLNFVSINGDLSFNISPEDGYYINHIFINGEEVDISSKISLKNINQNHSIEIEFAKKTSDIDTNKVYVFDAIKDDGNIGAVKVFLTIVIVGVWAFLIYKAIKDYREGADE